MTRSKRGLWNEARQLSGKLRDPWTVETKALEKELKRRYEASHNYHKNMRSFGFNSAVTRRNEEMIHRIIYILDTRDGIADDLPF